MGGFLTTAKSGTVGATPAGFEERLEWLCRFGKPRISRVSDGWFASIDMNTNTTGAEFKVTSDLGHATPSAALNIMIQRMLETLVKLGASA